MTLAVYLYTAYFVIGLFLAHNVATQKENDAKKLNQKLDFNSYAIGLMLIGLFWPLYLIYKYTKKLWR